MKSYLFRNLLIGGAVTTLGVFTLNTMTALAQGNDNQNRSNTPRNGQMMNQHDRANCGQGQMMQNLTPEERQEMQERYDRNGMRQNEQPMMDRSQPRMDRDQFNRQNQQ